MKWFERGQISFVFLWVLNPAVILFYQNCAPSHLSQAAQSKKDAPAQQIELEINSSQREPACAGLKTNCAQP